MDYLIEVKDLCKSFKTHYRDESLVGSIKSFFNRKYQNIEILKGLNFSVKGGEILGLIGLNGAGKTTTIKILAGVLNKTSGSLNILGLDPWNKTKEFKKSISLVMGQRFQANSDLIPKDIFKFFSIMYGLDHETYLIRSEMLCKMLGLTKNETNKQVRQLSLGQKMKVELVISMLHFPKVIFLDEPTLGLDFISQKTIRVFLKKYAKDNNAAIILTSHYFKDIEELSDRIFIINKGTEIFSGDIKQLKKESMQISTVTIKSSEELSFSYFDISEEFNISKNVEDDTYIYIVNIEKERTSEFLSSAYKEYNSIIDISIEEDSLECIIDNLYKR